MKARTCNLKSNPEQTHENKHPRTLCTHSSALPASPKRSPRAALKTGFPQEQPARTLTMASLRAPSWGPFQPLARTALPGTVSDLLVTEAGGLHCPHVTERTSGAAEHCSPAALTSLPFPGSGFLVSLTLAICPCACLVFHIFQGRFCSYQNLQVLRTVALVIRPLPFPWGQHRVSRSPHCPKLTSSAAGSFLLWQRRPRAWHCPSACSPGPGTHPSPCPWIHVFQLLTSMWLHLPLCPRPHCQFRVAHSRCSVGTSATVYNMTSRPCSVPLRLTVCAASVIFDKCEYVPFLLKTLHWLRTAFAGKLQLSRVDLLLPCTPSPICPTI